MKIAKYAIAAAFALAWGLGAGSASATIQTYDFSGTLAGTPGCGSGTSVSGQFTLNNAGSGSITSFSFSTPCGTFNTTNTAANVSAFTAFSPSGTDFVSMSFNHNLSPISFTGFILFYETSLAGFDGSNFYTGPIVEQAGFGITDSKFIDGLDFENPTSKAFTSATTTPVAPTPEPGSLLLLASGLLGLAGYIRRK